MFGEEEQAQSQSVERTSVSTATIINNSLEYFVCCRISNMAVTQYECNLFLLYFTS